MIMLLQVFLSQVTSPSPMISEVSLDTETEELLCTCPGYTGRGICKHTLEVARRIAENNGAYPMNIAKDAPEGGLEKAKSSEQVFRTFILEFGRVDTL